MYDPIVIRGGCCLCIVALYCDYGCDTDEAENKFQLGTISNNIHENKRQEEAREIAN